MSESTGKQVKQRAGKGEERGVNVKLLILSLRDYLCFIGFSISRIHGPYFSSKL